jgi:bifunctional isochorismate lyase/aryl carrier protein
MMSIPGNVSYPMPSEESLPESTADWRPDPSRAALLIHDMQQYFVDFYAPAASPVTELVANSVALKRAADATGMPVFYTAQPGSMTREERGLLMDVWGPGMRAEGDHRRVIDALTPNDRDTVLVKWRYSAFARTDLSDRLRSLGRDQLVICGIYAHIGCMMSAADAFTRDIQPFFAADALADFSADYHRQALTWTAERCAVVRSTRQLLGHLTPGPASASDPAAAGKALTRH